MFPTAHSTIIRNEDGEVLGWDNTYYDEAPDQDLFYDDEEDFEDIDPATCEHGDRTQIDLRTGRPHLEEMPTEDAIRWECDRCDTILPLTPEDWKEYWDEA